MYRVSSHIPSLDAILFGGFLPGSTVLLLSEYGAGGRELMQTSVVNCCRSCQTENTASYHSSRFGKETFLQNLWRMFHIAPGQIETIAFEEIHALNPNELPVSKICCIDSLTRYLPRLDDAAWYSLLDELYEYTKSTKKRETVSLFLLATGVLSPQREAELKDCFDAVFSFRWAEPPGSSTRNRALVIEKYDGMPFFAAPKSYHIRILPENGFEISNLRRIQ